MRRGKVAIGIFAALIIAAIFVWHVTAGNPVSVCAKALAASEESGSVQSADSMPACDKLSFAQQEQAVSQALQIVEQQDFPNG